MTLISTKVFLEATADFWAFAPTEPQRPNWYGVVAATPEVTLPLDSCTLTALFLSGFNALCVCFGFSELQNFALATSAHLASTAARSAHLLLAGEVMAMAGADREISITQVSHALTGTHLEALLR